MQLEMLLCIGKQIMQVLTDLCDCDKKFSYAGENDFKRVLKDLRDWKCSYATETILCEF